MTARYLTKSRFKLALECPTKLYYSGNPDYADRSADNSFLAALAEGGYQVGALACTMFPEGVEVDNIGHVAQLERTRSLLKQDTVTIFEAALEAQGLFVRVDVLRKRGDRVEIIEVKAKSFDPSQDCDFRNRQGQLRSGWLPYLHDVAFQCHVAKLALPHFAIRGELMLVDKSARATVDRLNQRFALQRKGGRLHVVVAPGADAAALGAPILVRVPVDDAVTEIHASTLIVEGAELPYGEAVAHIAAAYRNGRRLAAAPGAQCGDCQYRSDNPPARHEPRSGFHECWSAAFGWTSADFAGGTVLDIWNLRSKGKLIASGVLKPQSVTHEDLGHDGDDEAGLTGMTRKQRQSYQCHGDWPGGGDFYIDTDGLRTAMRSWRYPLHFIDFETCAVAIPFTRGRRPYETVAFQFSHHVMHEDGRVEHRTQFLEATPGVEPCIPFLRALRQALGSDSGTVFRWSSHENTVLNQLRDRLLVDPGRPNDAGELIDFIETITTRKGAAGPVAGPRSMVDLCQLAERHFFDPMTRGSSSLKKVLPALMKSSAWLRSTYSKPVYASAEMPSLNLAQPMLWWVMGEHGVCDPYDLLPPVFTDVTRAELGSAIESLPPDLQEGGAAMTAYARLQFESIEPEHRTAIEQALLRYCELDTLAMVMAVQAWRAWIDERASSASGGLERLAA